MSLKFFAFDERSCQGTRFTTANCPVHSARPLDFVWKKYAVMLLTLLSLIFFQYHSECVQHAKK